MDTQEESLALLASPKPHLRAGRRAPSFTITRQDGCFVVVGLERLVERYDLTDEEAARELALRFYRLGLEDELRAAGAKPGIRLLVTASLNWKTSACYNTENCGRVEVRDGKTDWSHGRHI